MTPLRHLLCALLTCLLWAGGARAADLPGAPPAAAWATQALELINATRVAAGIGALQPAPEFKGLAQAHSAAMRALGALTHAGFETRLERSGSSECVEAVGVDRARTPLPRVHALLAAWLRSPSHRDSVLDPGVRRVAVEAHGHYVTFFACR